MQQVGSYIRSKNLRKKMAYKIQTFVVFLSGIFIGMFLISNEHSNKSLTHAYKQYENFKKNKKFNEWPDGFQVVNIASDVDNTVQPAYYYMPNIASAVPLVISLHTWRGDYREYDPVSEFIKDAQYAYIHPNFRGRMNSPKSCCSDLVIADIDMAIDFAISNGNVDPDRIYLIGVSGGAYTALCSYFRSKHVFKKIISWLPITDLEAWYKENLIRKELNFANDILACTNSTEGHLNTPEAHARSPLYFDLPKHRFNNIDLDIYAGVYDGTFGNGTVPVTHAAFFYNNILRNMGIHDANALISDRELLDLFEIKPPNKNLETINGNYVFLKKSIDNISVTFIGNGHDILPEYIFQQIKSE